MNRENSFFSDTQLLFYGKQHGFPRNPDNCLLRDLGSSSNQSLLEQAVQDFPSFSRLADYVCAGLMNPKIGFRVFADTGEGFLSFRAALPFVDIQNAAYGLLFSAGAEEGYLGCENKDTLLDMLTELSKVTNAASPSLSVELSPAAILVILGACDVINQYRYESGRFTALSVFNTLHTAGDTNINRVCFPLADTIGNLVCQELLPQDIIDVLGELKKAEIIQGDVSNGIELYCFNPDYRPIVELLSRCYKRFALHCVRTGGQEFIYLLSDDFQSWMIRIADNTAFIQQIDITKFRKLLNRMMREEEPEPVLSENWECICGATSNGNFCSTCGKKREEERLIYCSNCGKQLPLNTSFCNQCGKPVSRC